jgi:hypothetical protein
MAVAIGIAVVAFAIAFALAGIALFGGDDGEPHAASGSTTSTALTATSTTTSPTTATGTPPSTTASATAALAPLDIGRSYPVGTRTLTFVDSSRTTSANGSFPGAPSRTLPTEVWYPASTADQGAANASPDTAHGPYPLVLFAHGYAVTPDFYAPLLARWAAAGYVVAAPVFPILSGSDGGASHVDFEKTWGDASFVITQMLSLGADDPLAGVVDRSRIAVAGHSDGEMISFGLGFLQCCRDTRVRSILAMAGDLSNVGTLFASDPYALDTGTPILHVMETNDEYDPYQHSIDWDRANLKSPRWMVSLFSSHVPPYTQPGDAAFELVSSITVAYLDGTLKGHPERLNDLTGQVAAQPSVGTIER